MQTAVAPSRAERVIIGLIFVFASVWMLVCAAEKHMPVNPASRFAAIEAIVDNGTWAIDDTRMGGMTIDKVFWNEQFYSSKPPIVAMLGAPVYWLWQKAGGPTFAEDVYKPAVFIQSTINVLPWMLALLAFYSLVCRFAESPATRIWAFASLALGSLGTAYATHLNNHSLAMVAMVAAAAAGWPLVAGQVPSRVQLAIGGLAAGFACTFDLGAIPIVGMLSLLVAWELGRRKAWGALAIVAAFFVLAPGAQFFVQYGIAGTIKPFYTLPEAYNYPGSYWNRPVEFDALAEPKFLYAFNSFIGHHGLFSVTPALLLGLPWFAARESTPELRRLQAALAIGVGFVFAYYVLKTNNYGGRCVGMRWFMVVHIPLMLAAVRYVDRNRLADRYPVMLGVLTGMSAVSALAGAINPWEEGIVHVIFRAFGLGSVSG
jgi:hypothetical protein